ncbi:leucine rich repeat and phosphatase domain containing protein [Stylonychia lemnae]|uniref:protein-tyrosine-phosphatase n=1 Tax=Stylonychia lemnae TaxID=5949 RepID=A0A078ACY7_STYLE|nr:leucine rich repeat and phosphatase domain containing protein [Stylonychia lemnae]|eukprot:CDW78718.1 leucine rich repeat and phosphatase domain containing protein [Stylonychia lemnae]
MQSYFSYNPGVRDIDQILPNLYMSNVYAAENQQILQELKITHIVTVSAGIKPKYPSFYNYKVILVDDNPKFDVKQYFWDAIQFVEDAVQNNGVVLIHCAAGMSRSAAITIAYLMWKNKWTFKEAYDFGRSKRNKMFPNLGFQSQLRMFESEIFCDIPDSSEKEEQLKYDKVLKKIEEQKTF